jgi:hypothetical protein
MTGALGYWVPAFAGMTRGVCGGALPNKKAGVAAGFRLSFSSAPARAASRRA